MLNLTQYVQIFEGGSYKYKRNKAKESNIRYIEIFSLDNINFDEIKNNLKNKHIIYL